MFISSTDDSEAEDEPHRDRRTRRYGRPQKLTPALIDTIALVIRNGASDYVAAQAVGITHQTFDNWMRRGAA